MRTENQIEMSFIEKLKDLKYTYRDDIRDKASLEANFRDKFEKLNNIGRKQILIGEIEKGNEIIQESFELYEKEWNPDELDPHATYNLTEKVEWKNVIGGEKIVMEGRSIGGCLDCIKSYIGTKYDKVVNYIERHKEDGIIWFLECFEANTAQLQIMLWQMKNAGYFKNCNGIIFGRPLFIREEYGISFNEAIKTALEDLNIPIICDADIGHVSPQMAIVNGAILKITSENGKGIVETKLI